MLRKTRPTDIDGPVRSSSLKLECEEHLKVDLREISLEGVDWINLAQDRDRWRALVNTALNIRIP
jgi:hypothetical protein